VGFDLTSSKVLANSHTPQGLTLKQKRVMMSVAVGSAMYLCVSFLCVCANAVFVHVCLTRIVVCARSKEIAITFTPLRQGSVDALFAIDVEGLPQPLGVGIRSEIKGLVTGFSSLEPRALEVLPALPESTPEQREAVAYK
jgi:hypothetical protein